MGLAVGGVGGDDVPDVEGDDVGGDEIELVAAVGDSVGGDVAFVGVAALVFGGLDLDADEASFVLDGEVVGGGVSPRAGDAEALLGGAGHKEKLGPLAALFGVADIDSLI